MLLLSTFGTCYSRSFCLVCNNIEGKRKSQTIFKLVCRKWSLWTHKSNGCKLRIDSCHGPNQNSEQNLWGRMLARERFPTFAWQKKTSEWVLWALQRLCGRLLSASAWRIVWCHVATCDTSALCWSKRSKHLPLCAQRLCNYFIHIYIHIRRKKSPSGQCRHEDLN